MLRARRRTGLDVVIVNPTFVLGPDDPTRHLDGAGPPVPAAADPRLRRRRRSTSSTSATSPTGHLLADEKGEVGERYILGGRNFTLQRLFADLSRICGVPAAAAQAAAAASPSAGAELGGPARAAAPVGADEVARPRSGGPTRNARRSGSSASSRARTRRRSRTPCDGSSSSSATGSAPTRSRRRAARGRRLRRPGRAARARAGAGGMDRDRPLPLPDADQLLCPCGAVARRLRKLGLEHRTERVPYRRTRRPEIVELTGQRRVPVLIDGDEVDPRTRSGSGQYLDVGSALRATSAGRRVALGVPTPIDPLLYNVKPWTRPRQRSSSPTSPPARSRSCSPPGEADQALRVAVRGGGCSGFQYALALDKRKDDDHVFEHNGVAVVVDKVWMQFVFGSEVDYVDGLQGAGFAVNNPNVVAACGCGSSFQVREDAAEQAASV